MPGPGAMASKTAAVRKRRNRVWSNIGAPVGIVTQAGMFRLRLSFASLAQSSLNMTDSND
jgi:hypothetical protein